jgi:hypothetical protein
VIGTVSPGLSSPSQGEEGVGIDVGTLSGIVVVCRHSWVISSDVCLSRPSCLPSTFL